MSGKKRAVFVVGPTASGKSHLALELAAANKLSIINADSMQIYQGLDIGSASPDKSELERAPHFLYNYVEKGKAVTVADYVADVTALLKKDVSPPLVFCGGSGFYIQALEKGMYEVTKLSPALRSEIQSMIDDKGFDGVYQWILEKDPGLKRTVHGNDHYRIRRALEIMVSTQRTPADLQKKLTPSPLNGFSITKVALYAEKDVLRSRVEERAETMLKKGFVEEVEGLIAQGLSDWRPLQSVGYKEVGHYLRGEIAKADLAKAIADSTMKLIKKQLTWFKKDPGVRWFHVSKMGAAQDFAQKCLTGD